MTSTVPLYPFIGTVAFSPVISVWVSEGNRLNGFRLY
jgi:hypothetical protein